MCFIEKKKNWIRYFVYNDNDEKRDCDTKNVFYIGSYHPNFVVSVNQMVNKINGVLKSYYSLTIY